jgi:hypothetical protein
MNDKSIFNLQRHETAALVSCKIKLLAFSYYGTEQSSSCFTYNLVVMKAISSTIKMILTFYYITQAEQEREREIYYLYSCTLLQYKP